MADLAQEFGLLLRHMRKAAELTQLQVADMAGCGRPHIQKIEYGLIRVTLDDAVKLAAIFNTPLAEMACGHGTAENAFIAGRIHRSMDRAIRERIADQILNGGDPDV
jgi:transcriptional regulator with XRE-family HTH domain